MKAAGQFESRKRARRRALQALYQWQITRQEAGEIIGQFLEEQDFSSVDTKLFHALVNGVVSTRKDLDEALSEFLDRPAEQLDVMEKVILRIAAFELLNSPEVPGRVILDEAIDLARRFGAEQGHSYVNGVLDRAARQWRKVELTGASTRSDG